MLTIAEGTLCRTRKLNDNDIPRDAYLNTTRAPDARPLFFSGKERMRKREREGERVLSFHIRDCFTLNIRRAKMSASATFLKEIVTRLPCDLAF